MWRTHPGAGQTIDPPSWSKLPSKHLPKPRSPLPLLPLLLQSPHLLHLHPLDISRRDRVSCAGPGAGTTTHGITTAARDGIRRRAGSGHGDGDLRGGCHGGWDGEAGS